MTTYNIGADETGGARQCLDAIIKKVKESGATVNDIGVNSNLETPLRTGNKDDIGVFVVNGVCLGTMLSCNEMAKAGGCAKVIFACPGSLVASPFNKKEAYTDKNHTLTLVSDGSNWKSEWYTKYDKKYTVEEICNELECVDYVFGETCEETGQAIVDGNFGTGGAGSGDTSGGEDENKTEPTPMSYLDMIKDLIKVWDGDVECKIRQNKMYINKVPQPRPRLWVVESNNIVSGQAKVTDYNSDTINTLNVSYNNGANTITITDEYLINRFGEVSADLEAEKIVTDYSGDGTNTEGTGTASGDSATQDPSQWTQIATILQKYYEKPSGGWDDLIRGCRDAKTGDEIGKLISKQKMKKGYEHTSHVSIRHEIQTVRGMGY